MSKEKQTISKQLAKCPFCGGEAEITINKTRQGQTSVVRCTKCTCRKTLLKYPFYEGDIYVDAVKDWNTRKPLERIVERLEYEYHEIDKCKKESYEDGEWERFDMFANLKNGIGRAIVIVKEEGGLHE